MILGYTLFGDINLAPNITSIPSSVLISGATFDQIRVDSELPTDELAFTKEDWSGNTVMQADFEGDTLDSGSLGAAIEQITHISLKRKRYDDLEWVTLDNIEIGEIFDGIYTFIDRTADPAERYEYAIVPVATGDEYNYFIQTVDTEMQTCYLYDRDTRYELYYNFEFDDFSYNMPNEVLETMGNQYPVVVYNNNLNYAEGGLKCLLYASDEDNLSIMREKKLRREIMSFLMNRKPKAIKGYDGTHMMIAIVDSPTLSPNARGVYDLSFNFVEIGDMNKQYDLYNNNFSDIPVEGESPVTPGGDDEDGGSP